MMVQRRHILAAPALLLPATAGGPAGAQSRAATLVVAGPRVPESLDQEYPPTEAGHEARRNIFERLLRYAPKTQDGVQAENFDVLEGALAENWDLAPDGRSITFRLRPGVKSFAGNTLSADDVMWTFERGWNLKATFHWYMTQVLKITSFEDAFRKLDDMTVRVSLPSASPLLARLWVNNDLGIIDSAEAKKRATAEDPWASRFLATSSASFAPYHVTEFVPGQRVVYQANMAYYRGAPRLERVIFQEMPTSANRLAALQAGSVDVAEWLLPRELALLQSSPTTKVWTVFGNYIHRLEMNNTLKPFDDARVRRALNHLVPRDAMARSIYFNTARPTRSPISEIYPGWTGDYFAFDTSVEKAKALLNEAGYPDGFQTEIGYRADDQLEEEMAVALRTAFGRAGVQAQLSKMPSSTLVERYTKGQMPMYFFRDMAIVPDAAYVANLWLNSKSIVNYARFKVDEVDNLINAGLTSVDEPRRLADSRRVQQITMEQAPWVFLFNPGYQLATRANVKGFSWYTPNGNSWYDFYKEG
ncbi:ABC transporter substrate-binding protein [Paracraurococcus lichenis]|uniref:ABC transporter substrate-binding protein n=1 Tax=Paracraurococcus lichenis TaxID=3064888 RepID=A0ABT9ED09_9PROT|nr:ABC transporter substrate-binding protein [Paracraurococcus sp. LOR1-02]MDO9714079.1 ABC transporter substrate-binding protein [Paracraurococcus sp. LOR1-02]